MRVIVEDVNRTTRGWYEYFKHSQPWWFERLDRWIRVRLRSVQRRRRKGRGIGRGTDHQRWPNAYFAELGLFNMTSAHSLARQSP